MALNVKLNENFVIKLICPDREKHNKLENDDTFLVQTIIDLINKHVLKLRDGTQELITVERLEDNPDNVDEEILLEEGKDTNSSQSTQFKGQGHKLVWCSKGKPTTEDNEATGMLLDLRGAQYFKEKFDNKNSSKINLWRDIAAKMQEKGFSVSGEKCQQKFSNLQKLYINAVRHVYRTGTERKELPPFYNELHAILGSKDKTSPKNIVDTLEFPSELHCEASIPGTSTDCAENSKIIIKQDVPSSLKSKPPKVSKADMLKEIVNSNQSALQNQTEQFNKMFAIMENQNTLLKEQNNQRNKMLEILAAAFTKDKSKSRKRRHSSSDSE